MIIATERKSDFKLTTDTQYIALVGELWGVYYENFEENWPCYNGITLYYADICHGAIEAQGHQLLSYHLSHIFLERTTKSKFNKK